MENLQNALAKYIGVFKKLKRAPLKGGGKAPHKPILLLSVLMAYQNGLINGNRVYITPELVALFKSNWNALVVSNNVCSFPLPFFHLSTDKVWKLIPKPGYEYVIESRLVLNSFSSLNDAVEYAQIDEELLFLMKNESSNQLLKQYLLNEYFADQDIRGVAENTYQKTLQNIELSLLNEDPEKYKSEISQLIKDKHEEDIYLRGAMFKREIPKLYFNKCCISDLSIDDILGISMIDACHIVPFAKSHNDTVTNGISLCPNLHRAYDRGLISVNEDYTVLVSKKFKEQDSSYSIKQFDGCKISLPENNAYWPSIENLKWHKLNVFQ